MSEPIYNGEFPVKAQPEVDVVVRPEVDVIVQPEHALGAIIPTARSRKIAYAIYAGIALVISNTVVGYAAIGTDSPVWLIVASAVIGNLAAPFSALAIANAKS